MSRKTTIKGKAVDIDLCAEHIQRTYQADGCGTQKLFFEENGATGIIVQIKNSISTAGSVLRTVTGLNSCATLKLTATGNDLVVEVMAGKWIDKVGAAVVSWFVLWPLFVTAAIGAFRQKAFLDKVYNDAMTWLATEKGQ